jgi:hypothetical protein
MTTQRWSSHALWALLLIAGLAALPYKRLPPPAAPHQPRATICTCSDVFDLINRLNMAELAVELLNQEIAKIQALELKAGRKFMLDERNPKGATNYDQIVTAINEAMSSAQMMGGKTTHSETDGNCDVKVPPSGSWCIDEIANHHERQVHVPACQADKAAGRTTLLGRRATATAVAYMQEDIKGYEAEIARIRDILQRMHHTCRGSWVGRVKYFEQNVSEQVIILPPNVPRGTRVSGSQKIANDFSRESRVLYRDFGHSVINVRTKQIGSIADEGVARTYCGGGPRGSTGPQHTIATKIVTRTERSGYTEGTAQITFGFDSLTGIVTLALTVPRSTDNGTSTTTETRAGMCNPTDNGTTSNSIAATGSHDGTSVTAVDTVTPTSVTISGERTFVAPLPTVPGRTETRTARLTWVLHKIP